MAISLSGHVRYGQQKKAAKYIAEQQKRAQAAEDKRKGRSKLFGGIGGALLGAAAVGLTGLTGGLAAPLVMGVAASLGKKWADDASKGAAGKWLKSPGQVDKIKAGFAGYGREHAESVTKGLRESRKSTWSPESMLGDIAGSYLTAGIGGGLGGAKDALKAGNIAGAFRGTGVTGMEGLKQSMAGMIPGGEGTSDIGASDLWGGGADVTMDYASLAGSGLTEGGYDALVASRQAGADIEDVDDFWDLVEPVIGQSYETDFAQGGQVMDQNTLTALTILSQMANKQNTYDNTPLEETQPSLAEIFESKGKTLGGNNIKSLSQMLGR